MLKEFRDFISRGNVMDLAVGIIIGVAFTAIVNSLVNDIIMPIIGVILGGVDFASLSITIGSATINYGLFIQAVINFLIIALVVFFLVKGINAMSKKPAPKPAAPTAPPEDIQLLMQIRDLLKQQAGRPK